MYFDWSEANCEKLQQMRARGLSASVIGDVLGVSRNAVIGKLSRLKVRCPDEVINIDGLKQRVHSR